MTGVDETLAAAGTALAAACGTELSLRHVESLGSSPRTRVLRATVVGAGRGVRGVGRTVIVKAHLDEGPWATAVREPAGLELLSSYAGRPPLAPRLLAVAGEPPLVVLSDLADDSGGAPTDRDLAALLLGRDPVAAESGLRAWAETVARLHVLTAGWTADVTAALAAAAARLGRTPPPADEMPDALDRAAATLGDLLPRLGVQPAAAALAEVRHLQDGLGGGPGCWAMTPGDTCPDNNVLTADGLVLFDFEGAGARHVAWDAAYLRVPWPSCWCSWQVPAPVAERALDRWRTVVAEAVPHVGSAAFDVDLERAEAGWAAVSTGWFLAGALEADEVPGGEAGRRVAPGRRALLLHRLGRAAAGATPGLGAWAALAGETHEAALRAWGPVELLVAPAFRGHG